MGTEKSMASMAAEQGQPPDGALNFSVEAKGLREAEAAMDRLQAKAEQFSAQLRQGTAEKLLQAQLELLAEKSKTAGAGELCDLSRAMVDVHECLEGIQSRRAEAATTTTYTFGAR